MRTQLGQATNPVAILGQAGLAPTQLANAQLILRQFLLAGYPVGLALAAIVNAKAESNLDARAVAGEPKGGFSVGLFQLYDYGAGRGMAISPGSPPPPSDPRFDPTRNTHRILEEVRSHGGNLMAAYQQGASVAQLVGIFTTDIERPANSRAKAVEREALARRLLGPVADTAALSLQAAAPALFVAAVPWWGWALGGVTIGLGLIGVLAFARGRTRGSRL